MSCFNAVKRLTYKVSLKFVYSQRENYKDGL